MKNRPILLMSIIMMLTFVLLSISSFADVSPIWMNALDSDSDSTVDGGVIISGPSAYVTGAIDNAFLGNSSRYVNWDNTTVGTIFASWDNNLGHTIDLYFRGDHWSTHSGDSGLFCIAERYDGYDGFWILSVRDGKLRFPYRDSYTNYAFTAELTSFTLSDNVTYRLTLRQQGNNFEVYLDDIDGTQYSNTSPIHTQTISNGGASIAFPAPNSTSTQRVMNVGNRGPFGGILQAGEWVDNVRVFNGYYTPAEIGANSTPPTNYPVTITTQPSNTAVITGTTATFTIVAQSTQPMTYQWQKDMVDLSDGGGISGVTTNTLQISSAQESDEGAYRCIVENGYDSKTSTEATLTVNPTVVVGRQTLYEFSTGRRYILYVPLDYTATKSYPLVISSHGTNQNGDTEMDSTGPNSGWDQGTPTWPQLVDAGNDVIVACPDMTGAYGESGCAISSTHATELASDETAILGIINEIEGGYNIDASRILLTGFSGGGNVVHYVGLRHPELFAATCARHGNFDTALVPSPLPSGVQNMPVFIFTREQDITCGNSEAIAWYQNANFSSLKTELYPAIDGWVNWYDNHVTDRHYALEWFLNLGLKISSDGHWIEFRGKKALLIGDSVTQGWMESGSNFNYTGYIDALSSRGINVVMLWSYIATSASKQIGDNRIGYDSPEYWPWTKNGNVFDLNSFDTTYFAALEDLVSYANGKDMAVLITIHDGWTKTLFADHPFNSVNGGPLTANSQYVELADYNNEMGDTYNAGWNYLQKNQYFQEQFVKRLIEAVGSYPNVIFEICNEGEWYNQTSFRAYQVHFLNYIKARTSIITMVNDDHVGGASFNGEANCDTISLHMPQWNSSSTATTFFNTYAGAYSGSPAKPQFFSEPVPEWQGDSTLIDPMMRVMWGTILGAGGYVCQNDASFGWDPYTSMAAEATDRNTMYDRIGHCARFMNDSGINIGTMVPSGSLASTGVCLASPGAEYVVYSQSGTTFTVNLSAASGTLYCRFYNPRTGIFEPTFQRTGGSSAESFTKPDSSDWVLHITNGQSPFSPIIMAVDLNPDTNAFSGTAYTKQLQLQQGASPISWSVVQGPAGLTVDSSGLISGWTPVGCDVGNAVTIEIQAQNSYGSDTETWQVQPQVYYIADNIVNVNDLTQMASEWLMLDTDLITDLGCNGKVDLGDFALLAQNWLLEIVNLEVTNMNQSNYVVSYNNLDVGEVVYIDRTYTYTNVPAYIGNKTFIQTANDDKYSTGDSFLTFTINMPCTVYVLHDDTITTKPTWLSSFVDTNDNVTSNNPETYSVFKKDFNAGPVVLGGNGGGVSSSMYTVVIVEK